MMSSRTGDCSQNGNEKNDVLVVVFCMINIYTLQQKKLHGKNTNFPRVIPSGQNTLVIIFGPENLAKDHHFCARKSHSGVFIIIRIEGKNTLHVIGGCKCDVL
jgi:hypothetical protein